MLYWPFLDVLMFMTQQSCLQVAQPILKQLAIALFLDFLAILIMFQCFAKRSKKESEGFRSGRSGTSMEEKHSEKSPRAIPPHDWFDLIMEIREPQWDFVTLPPGPKFGDFKTFSIRELRELGSKRTSRGSAPWLHVKTRSRMERNDLFDTSAIQVRSPPGTLIQVASNFNCLELSSALSNPFDGKFLTRLMTDSTQGPSAAAGAGPGAIKRLQLHRAQEINLLCDLSLEAPNGKLFDVKEGALEDAEAVRVGLHTDVQAVFDRSGRECVFHPAGVCIDQVFASTIILRKGRAKPRQVTASQTLLRQAYTGTYLSAIYRQSPRVVLTLIGGGAFNNAPEDIADALAEAHTSLGPFLAETCEVELPLFEPNAPILKLLKKRLEVLVTSF